MKFVFVCISTMAVVIAQPFIAILEKMNVPLVYVKPGDQQVVKNKFDHLLQARNQAVKTPPFIRERDALNDFLSQPEILDAEANLALLLQRPEGQPLLKLIQKVANAVNSNMDIERGIFSISPALIFELTNALKGKDPEIMKAMLQPEFKIILKDIHNALFTPQAVRLMRVTIDIRRSH